LIDSHGSTAAAINRRSCRCRDFDLRLIFIDADRGGNAFDGFFADFGKRSWLARAATTASDTMQRTLWVLASSSIRAAMLMASP
jgi:hypothetical protein